MPRIRFLAAPCAGALAIALAVPAHGADLLSIFQRARHNDPAFAAARARYRARLEAQPQARAAILPQINLRASYAKVSQESRGRSDEYTRRQYSLELRQPLFDWAAFVGLDRADAIVARAEAKLAAAKQDLILRVAKAYFDVLNARDNLRLARAEKEAIARQLERARTRFEVGLIPIADVKAAQAAFDLAQARLIAARNRLATARGNLRTLLDRPPGELAALSEELPLKPPDPNALEPWVERALKGNPRLLAARAATRVARTEIAQARAGFYPEIDLYLRHSDTETSLDGSAGALGGFDSAENEIGVALTWNLFNGFGTVSRTDEARARFQAAQAQAVDVRRTIKQNTREAFRGVMAAISRVKALAEAVESNRAALEAVRAGFKVGTRTMVDVLEALRDLYEAQRDYAEARYTYVINRLRLERAAGTLTVDDLRAVNAWLVETPS